MKEYLNQKVLVTTSNWFYAPDGAQYRGVWGTLKGIHESKAIFGFTPSRQHTNWVVEIGNVVISGCQVHYLILCPSPPPVIVDEQVNREHELDVKVIDYRMRSRIYLTE